MPGASMKEAVDDFERQYISHVLRSNQYNKEMTAKALKISFHPCTGSWRN